MKGIFIGLANRFKEPSSWGVIATLLTGLGLTIDAELLKSITLVGAGGAGLLAFFLKEKGAPGA